MKKKTWLKLKKLFEKKRTEPAQTQAEQLEDKALENHTNAVHIACMILYNPEESAKELYRQTRKTLKQRNTKTENQQTVSDLLKNLHSCLITLRDRRTHPVKQELEEAADTAQLLHSLLEQTQKHRELENNKKEAETANLEIARYRWKYTVTCKLLETKLAKQRQDRNNEEKEKQKTNKKEQKLIKLLLKTTKRNMKKISQREYYTHLQKQEETTDTENKTASNEKASNEKASNETVLVVHKINATDRQMLVWGDLYVDMHATCIKTANMSTEQKGQRKQVGFSLIPHTTLARHTNTLEQTYFAVLQETPEILQTAVTLYSETDITFKESLEMSRTLNKS